MAAFFQQFRPMGIPHHLKSNVGICSKESIVRCVPPDYSFLAEEEMVMVSPLLLNVIVGIQHFTKRNFHNR